MGKQAVAPLTFRRSGAVRFRRVTMGGIAGGSRPCAAS